MKILFSPVGDTDPIRDMYDGACLHIIRHYKPDAVKIFMTKDMSDKERRDQRFTKAIKALSPEIEIDYHYTDIVKANSFDIFMKTIPESLAAFMQKYPDAEVLLNIASGTPQMKATLAVLAIEWPKCKGIQVNSPAGRSNRDNRPEKDNIEVEELIKNNLDNEPDAVNRCEEPPLEFFRNFRERNQIISLIKARRYGAAWALAQEDDSTISANTRKLLEYGFKRSKLELKTAKSLCTKEERNKFHVVKDDAAEKLFEYFLVMQNNALNKDYAELLMKLTPFMYELLREHIKRNINCNDFFEVCCEQKTKHGIKVPVLTREKLKAWNPEVLSYLDSKFDGFNDSDASFINLYHIVSSFPLEKITQANQNLMSIFSSEKGVDAVKLNNLRNKVAHNIIMNVTQEDFRQATGLSPEKLIDVLFEALRTVFASSSKTKISKEARNSYDELNEYIKKSMDLSVNDG